MTFVFTFFIIIRRRAIIECALVLIDSPLSCLENQLFNELWPNHQKINFEANEAQKIARCLARCDESLIFSLNFF